jgi:hypothetical protein
MAPAYVTPLKKWLEKLVHTRFFTWFSPCVWGDSDGYARIRSFYHSTAFGRFIVEKFWGVLGGDVITLNKYDAHPETAKLKPWSNPFFIASGLSILNYDTDFFDLVRNGTVAVHIADITGLSARAVHLSSGERLPTDALICATGWKHTPPLQFLPAGIDLGLPHKTTSFEPTALIDQTDKEILSRFPRLKDQPVQNPKYKPLTDTEGVTDPTNAAEDKLEPYRLYRFIVPPAFIKSYDVAFPGSMMTISTALCAQTQALWITAFLNKQITIPEDIAYETVLHNRFGKWRYPSGFGDKFPDIVFDTLPYLDMLLQDLGLKNHRKGGILADIFSPYGPEDYKGLVEEWKATKRGVKVPTE